MMFNQADKTGFCRLFYYLNFRATVDFAKTIDTNYFLIEIITLPLTVLMYDGCLASAVVQRMRGSFDRGSLRTSRLQNVIGNLKVWLALNRRMALEN